MEFFEQLRYGRSQFLDEARWQPVFALPVSLAPGISDAECLPRPSQRDVEESTLLVYRFGGRKLFFNEFCWQIQAPLASDSSGKLPFNRIKHEDVIKFQTFRAVSCG